MTAWVSFDLKSGRRGAEVKVAKLGQVDRKIGESSDVNLDAWCWDAANGVPVPGWEAATQPGAAGLIAVDAEDNILWGGYIIRRRSAIGDAKVTVTVATLEHYLDRRYVSTHEWTGVDDSVIFAGLAADAVAGGPPMIVDCPATGRLKDRYYYDDEDKRVLGSLQELMGVEDGIEFTVVPEWTDATHTMVRFRLIGRPRLGAAATLPKVTFNYPGNLIGGDYLEDYTDEHGANDIMATSSGEGEDRPQSEHKTAILPTWVKFERRISPATSITEDVTLNGHASEELAQTWDGLKQLSLEARLDESTHPQVWSIGDDVRVSITSPRFPERVASDLSLGDGYSAVVRAIGWSMDLDARTITPTLVERQEIP